MKHRKDETTAPGTGRPETDEEVDRENAEADEWGAESFPASDPPENY